MYVRRLDNASASVGLTAAFVEFVDTHNRLAKVRFVNVPSYFVEKDIPRSSLLANNPNVDLTHIKQINFVVDSQTPQTGTMVVQVAGLAYTPVVSGTAYNPALLTSLTGSPAIYGVSSSAGGTANGTISLSQPDRNNFSFSDTLRDADD